MPTSNEELQKKAERIEKLREQVARAETSRVVHEREISNDIEMRRLEAEEAMLQARLAVAKEQGKVSTVKAGVETTVSAIEEQMKRAVSQQEAAEESPDRSARKTESSTPSGETAAKAAAPSKAATTGKES
jgi:uncharacterized protein (DUF342 family)